MDFELRQAREKLEREQRERMQRAKAKAERERRAKAEAARRREALEASHRERRLDAARAQEEVTSSTPYMPSLCERKSVASATNLCIRFA
jgi:membrane protein involved in colicin uptake